MILLTNLLIKLFIKDYNNVTNDKVRQKYGLLSSITGIVCNVLLCILKFLAGTLSGSISITADGFNNLSDAGSFIVSLVGFKISSAPADKEHPFGHGRVEYISGLVVSIIIILMGIELIKTSIEKIIQVQTVSFSLVSVIILIVSILVKLWMSLFNKKIGNKIKSVTLKAIAMDSLNDVIATISILISVILNYLFSWQIDGYIGILVSLFVLYTGYSNIKEMLDLLLGKMPEKELVDDIKKTVLDFKDVLGIHDLIINNYGPNRSIISLHAEMPCNMDILVMHDEVDEIERKLKQKFDCEAVIHMDPVVVDDDELNQVKEKVFTVLNIIDSQLSMHDFRIVKGISRTKLIFDVVIPYKFRLSEEKLIKKIDVGVKMIDKNYDIIVDIDRSYV